MSQKPGYPIAVFQHVIQKLTLMTSQNKKMKVA